MMPGQNKSWTEPAQMLSKPDSPAQMNYVPAHTMSGPTAQMNYDPAQMHYAPGQMISGPAIPHQNYGTPRVMNETNIKPRLRFYAALIGLAITQFVLAVISVAFGLAAFFFGTSGTSDIGEFGIDIVFDIDWSGVWVGAAYIVASSCGLGSLRIPNGYRCLLVSYFVLLVISIVITPVLIAMSSVWVSDADNDWAANCHVHNNCVNGTVIVVQGGLTAELAMNTVLIIIGIAEMILGVISAAFLCCNWNGVCCGVFCGCKLNISVETPYENYPKY